MSNPLPARCPVCMGSLMVTRLDCPECDTRIEGRFAPVGLERLSAEQRAFAEVFLRNRGVIKDVEADLGLSYPAVRTRVDEIAHDLGGPLSTSTRERPRPGSRRERRRAILLELQDRRISPEEAASALSALDTSP
jgi:hypothetical protein